MCGISSLTPPLFGPLGFAGYFYEAVVFGIFAFHPVLPGLGGRSFLVEIGVGDSLFLVLVMGRLLPFGRIIGCLRGLCVLFSLFGLSLLRVCHGMLGSLLLFRMLYGFFLPALQIFSMYGTQL